MIAPLQQFLSFLATVGGILLWMSLIWYFRGIDVEFNTPLAVGGLILMSPVIVMLAWFGIVGACPIARKKFLPTLRDFCIIQMMGEKVEPGYHVLWFAVLLPEHGSRHELRRRKRWLARVVSVFSASCPGATEGKPIVERRMNVRPPFRWWVMEVLVSKEAVSESDLKEMGVCVASGAEVSAKDMRIIRKNFR
ncbi:MAG: hypothetical protein JW888_01125 [Pirellulales bacterium]|nr:hypothetical protein [Pirellulales bacterium]